MPAAAAVWTRGQLGDAVDGRIERLGWTHVQTRRRQRFGLVHAGCVCVSVCLYERIVAAL